MSKVKTAGSGRLKGTPNKVTASARERFKYLMDSYDLEKMQDDLNSLSPKDRLYFISDISEYVIPKLQRTEITGGANNKVTLEIVRKYSTLGGLPPSSSTESD